MSNNMLSIIFRAKIFFNNMFFLISCLNLFVYFANPLPNDQYLTHYWPICNGEMKDHVGLADMTQGASTNFTNDKNSNPNCALALNGGWTLVPTDVYFNTPQFTISAWIYPQTIGSWARLIDFGNGKNSDNIVFAIGSPTNKPAFQICHSGSCNINLFSSKALALNQWNFLTVTFDGKIFVIYIDSKQTGNLSFSYSMLNLSRSSNFIGKSNMGGSDGYSFSYLDDLRFYNVSLSATDVVNLMNAGRNYFYVLLLKYI